MNENERLLVPHRRRSVNRSALLCYVMSRRHSVNRPPTPDVRDDDDDDEDDRPKEPTLLEIVNIKLIESGEKERLMELVRERLVECGWKDEMRALCRAFIKKNGRENVTVDDLVRAITPKGRASIPDSVKAELLQKIRTFLVSVAH
ncbi:Transcription and export factor ENY2 [Sesamum alatum]|uniref:Transcription and mRNA export factor ENY2 n=1 Tax=Sesamum alatum TaxID=300844 RepID=A0AAE1Y960_9LAMI|nr:Transcription and export factor ENY2 [Sesamum alatum]